MIECMNNDWINNEWMNEWMNEWINEYHKIETTFICAFFYSADNRANPEHC